MLIALLMLPIVCGMDLARIVVNEPTNNVVDPTLMVLLELEMSMPTVILSLVYALISVSVIKIAQNRADLIANLNVVAV
jgi:hypothetical protein